MQLPVLLARPIVIDTDFVSIQLFRLAMNYLLFMVNLNSFDQRQKC